MRKAAISPWSADNRGTPPVIPQQLATSETQNGGPKVAAKPARKPRPVYAAAWQCPNPGFADGVADRCPSTRGMPNISAMQLFDGSASSSRDGLRYDNIRRSFDV